jgi:hypothetical protein
MTPGANLFFDSMIVNLAASRADADIETLLESGHVQCQLPYSAATEATRPGVPVPIRVATARFLYTIMAPLTVPERADSSASTEAPVLGGAVNGTPAVNTTKGMLP